MLLTWPAQELSPGREVIVSLGQATHITEQQQRQRRASQPAGHSISHQEAAAAAAEQTRRQEYPALIQIHLPKDISRLRAPSWRRACPRRPRAARRRRRRRFSREKSSGPASSSPARRRPSGDMVASVAERMKMTHLASARRPGRLGCCATGRRRAPTSAAAGRVTAVCHTTSPLRRAPLLANRLQEENTGHCVALNCGRL
jgi:hypothetical protein